MNDEVKAHGPDRQARERALLVHLEAVLAQAEYGSNSTPVTGERCECRWASDRAELVQIPTLLLPPLERDASLAA